MSRRDATPAAGCTPSLDAPTVDTDAEPRKTDVARMPGLTVLAHPRPDRVGTRVPLAALRESGTVSLSRLEPLFVPAVGDSYAPLEDRHLSREAIVTFRADPGLSLHPGAQRFTLDGRPVRGPVEVSADRLRDGLVIVLARRVALLLHEMVVPPLEPLPGFELLGGSHALIEVQREVQRVRNLPVPVLLHGETGTGKELVARSIHRAGDRADEPFVAVNMAALPPTLAAAELFGVARGAYTGADRQRSGLVREALGGTLFLDEVGIMPSDVQVLLLRFLEDREVRPVGATRGEQVDVRVIAATDSDLDRAVDTGGFSLALLQRLCGYEITLPPLRERKDDLGLLLYHFLARELRALGKEELLSDPGEGRRPWLPADVFAVLARHSWPGNVRELGNVARRLAIRYHDRAVVARGSVDELLGVARQPRTALRHSEKNRRYRDPVDVTTAELTETLRACRWDVKGAAEALGVSRSSLYNLIDRDPRLRKASDLDDREIEDAYRACGGDLERMVDRLEVSKAGLATRLRARGLPRTSG